MQKACKSCFLVLILAVSIVGAQQAPKKVMTNADVVKLLKAGIPPDTIVLAIEHSKTNFDKSADALIALKRSGATRVVIDALVASDSKYDPANSPSESGASSENLNDEFSIAGLRALNALNGEVGVYQVGGGSHVTVPRATQQMIDDADAAGRTAECKAVVKLLNELFMLRLFINLERETYVNTHGYSPESDAQAGVDSYKQPTVIAQSAKLRSCSDAIDSVLRQRTFRAVPPECNNLSDSFTQQAQ